MTVLLGGGWVGGQPHEDQGQKEDRDTVDVALVPLKLQAAAIQGGSSGTRWTARDMEVQFYKDISWWTMAEKLGRDLPDKIKVLRFPR